MDVNVSVLLDDLKTAAEIRALRKTKSSMLLRFIRFVCGINARARTFFKDDRRGRFDDKSRGLAGARSF